MSKEERRRVWDEASKLEENQFPWNTSVCSRCSSCAGGRSPCESSDACPQPDPDPASMSQRCPFTPSMWTPNSCIRLYRQPDAGGPAPDPHLHHTPKWNLNKSNSWITIFSFSVVPGGLGMKAVENWAWLPPKYFKKNKSVNDNQIVAPTTVWLVWYPALIRQNTKFIIYTFLSFFSLCSWGLWNLDLWEKKLFRTSHDCSRLMSLRCWDPWTVSWISENCINRVQFIHFYAEKL